MNTLSSNPNRLKSAATATSLLAVLALTACTSGAGSSPSSHPTPSSRETLARPNSRPSQTATTEPIGRCAVDKLATELNPATRQVTFRFIAFYKAGTGPRAVTVNWGDYSPDNKPLPPESIAWGSVIKHIFGQPPLDPRTGTYNPAYHITSSVAFEQGSVITQVPCDDYWFGFTKGGAPFVDTTPVTGA